MEKDSPRFLEPRAVFIRKTEGQRILSSSDASTLPWVTPMKRFTSIPSFWIISVGTACMPYLEAISWFSSTSTTLNSTLSPYFFSSSSRIGFCILQGPHHVAEKSNNIGFIKSPLYFETSGNFSILFNPFREAYRRVVHTLPKGLYDKAAGNPILMIGDMKAGFTKYRVGTQ